MREKENNVSRSIFLIIFCFLLYALCVPVIAEDQHIVYTLGSTEAFRTLCEGENGSVYLLTSEALYQWHPATNQKESWVSVVCQNDLNIVGVTAKGEKLYAVTDEQEICSWSGMKWEPLGQPSWGKADDKIFRCCAVWTPDALYYLFKDVNDDVVFSSYDFETKQFTRSSLFDISWCSYDEQRGVLIGFMHDTGKNQWYMAAYDPLNDVVVDKFETDLPERSAAFAYDTFTQNIYFNRNSGMSVLDHNGVESDIPGVPALGGFIVTQDGKLSGIVNHQLGIYNPTNPEAGRITVMGFETIYNSGFTQQNKIAVELREPQEGDIMEDISRTLSTRDGSVDVFSFWTEEGLQAVKEKGFYVNLNDSEVLYGAYRELYPNIAKPLMKGADLVAWPVRIQPSLRMEDTVFLETCNLSSPKTWDDLLDLMPKLIACDKFLESGCVPFGSLSYDRASVFEFFVQQYIFSEQSKQAVMTFDTDVFREIAGRILTEVPVQDPFPRMDGTEGSVIQLESVSNIINKDQLAPLKIEKEAPAGIYASVQVLVINPYSNHKAEALSYLEYMASKRTVEDYALYASMNEPLYNASVLDKLETARGALAQEEGKVVPDDQKSDHERKLQALQNEISAFEEDLYIVPQEAIAKYQVFAKQMTVLENAFILYNQNLASLCNRVSQGNITLDEFIHLANQFVQMVYAENRV